MKNLELVVKKLERIDVSKDGKKHSNILLHHSPSEGIFELRVTSKVSDS